MLMIMHQTATMTLGNRYACRSMLNLIKNITKNLLIFYVSKRNILPEASISNSIYRIIHGHFGSWVIPITIVIHFSIHFLFLLNFTFSSPTFLSDIPGHLRVKLAPYKFYCLLQNFTTTILINSQTFETIIFLHLLFPQDKAIAIYLDFILSALFLVLLLVLLQIFSLFSNLPICRNSLLYLTINDTIITLPAFFYDFGC